MTAGVWENGGGREAWRGGSERPLSTSSRRLKQTGSQGSMQCASVGGGGLGAGSVQGGGRRRGGEEGVRGRSAGARPLLCQRTRALHGSAARAVRALRAHLRSAARRGSRAPRRVQTRGGGAPWPGSGAAWGRRLAACRCGAHLPPAKSLTGEQKHVGGRSRCGYACACLREGCGPLNRPAMSWAARTGQQRQVHMLAVVAASSPCREAGTRRHGLPHPLDVSPTPGCPPAALKQLSYALPHAPPATRPLLYPQPTHPLPAEPQNPGPRGPSHQPSAPGR